MRKFFNVFLSIFLFILLTAQQSYAAGKHDFPPSYYDVVAMFLIAVIIICFIALIYYEGKEPVELEKESYQKQSSAIFQFGKNITKTATVETENEILSDQDSDDIKELVSNVPSWFTWLFYITIFFAIAYLINYHVSNMSPLQDDEYQTEVNHAGFEKSSLGKSGLLLNEETVNLLSDPSSLNFGKQLYDVNCVACHASDGGGLVGPNLSDDYWIHGGGIKNVFSVIKYGVPAKGMIAWQGQLSPKQIQEVASYVISLHGKTTANPKQPEGTILKEEDLKK
jgi:cytochrome c oxidase cbb3-type subunit 3